MLALMCVSKATTLLKRFFTHLQTLCWKLIPKPRRQVLEAFCFVVKCVLKDEKQSQESVSRNNRWEHEHINSKKLACEPVLPQKQVVFPNYTLVACLYESTHRRDVGLHRQQVEESKELNSEDGVNLCGGQHQHSQREQHFEIRSVPPPLRHSVTNIHNFRVKWPHTAACTRSCVHVCCCHTWKTEWSLVEFWTH